MAIGFQKLIPIEPEWFLWGFLWCFSKSMFSTSLNICVSCFLLFYLEVGQGRGRGVAWDIFSNSSLGMDWGDLFETSTARKKEEDICNVAAMPLGFSVNLFYGWGRSREMGGGGGGEEDRRIVSEAPPTFTAGILWEGFLKTARDRSGVETMSGRCGCGGVVRRCGV